ncbi:hypothetical protein N9L60_02950 [Flavobacteriales bacterium]|nr:hypothetical protein [Flavobacteriales bacterium]
MNRKYTIPRIAKKSIQSISSNIIKSNSTSSLKLSGVKIIGNKDFKNELSSTSSKIGTSTKVETTTISGVEIILGSNNTIANKNLKSKKIQNIVKSKTVRPSNITTVKVNPPTNYIDNEELFKDNPLEEIDQTIIEDFTETLEEINTEDIASETTTQLVQEEVEPLETTAEEPLENIDETNTEEIASETTTQLVQEEVEPLETTVKEALENIDETSTEEIASETTTQLVQEEVEPLETTAEEPLENINETNTEEIESETISELVQDEVEPLETIVEEALENINETTTEKIASETTTELIQEEVEPLETTAEEPLENINETNTEEIESETISELVQDEVEPLETIVEEPLENINETNVEIVQEPSEENSIETQQPTIEDSPDKNSTEIVEDVIQESNAIVTPKENTPKKEQPVITNDSNFELSYSAKHENELANKAILYYTVRVKSVSNPTDGLKFLSKIKDNDAVWDEHTFHLFKDNEKENITNITIGKFVDKENAEELMAYLKTKNITNPSIEIHENIIKSTVNNAKPISKPINTTKPRAAIENPVNKVVESTETKKEVSSNKNLLDNISTKVDESENYFSVQVGANNKISSTNIQGLNLNKEKLFFVNIEQGKYAMNYGKHNDYGSAHKIALEIHKKGLETAFVTKYENGVRVKITKNDYLSDKTPKKTISDDINQLGYIPIGPNDKGKFIQIGTIYNWDAHNFKSLYDQLERTIYYKIKENNSVIFLVGPLKESEVFIELRTIKQIISDAFIKTF